MLLEQTYCFLLLSLLLVDDPPQLLSCKRHINVRKPQCRGHSVRNRRCRTDRASLAATFHTQRVNRSERDGGIKLIAGKLCCDRYSIVRQCRCQQLSILTIDDLLIHRLAHALRDTSMDLPLNEQRVDLASTVINRHEAFNLCIAGIFVYLNYTDMCAKREDACLWFPKDRHLQPRLNTRSNG